MKQPTLYEFQKRVDDAARRRREALEVVCLPGSPRMLESASLSLLRLGFGADTRRRVLVYVLDDPRRPCVYAARLLANHWKSATAACAAEAEIAATLSEYGPRSFVEMDKKTRERLKKLVRIRALHMEETARGWDCGPCVSVDRTGRLFWMDLQHERHGPNMIARAMKIAPRAFSPGVLGVYELRRRLYTEIVQKPPKCLFIW